MFVPLTILGSVCTHAYLLPHPCNTVPETVSGTPGWMINQCGKSCIHGGEITETVLCTWAERWRLTRMEYRLSNHYTERNSSSLPRPHPFRAAWTASPSGSNPLLRFLLVLSGGGEGGCMRGERRNRCDLKRKGTTEGHGALTGKMNMESADGKQSADGCVITVGGQCDWKDGPSQLPVSAAFVFICRNLPALSGRVDLNALRMKKWVLANGRVI